MDEITQFIWQRATGRGYVWQTLRTTTHKRVRLLTFPTPAGAAGAADLIQPQTINGTLLWRLAETDIDESAIKEFADAFGLLVGETMCWSKGGHPAYFGDPLVTWANAIARARMVIHLWTAAEAGNKIELKKAIRWIARKASVLLAWKDGAFENKSLIASPDHHPETLALFEPGDLVMPARIAVARVVNKQLEELTSPQLLWSEQARRFGIYLRPKNLLGAIWIQFAQIIDERKDIARCEVCGTWFERTRKDKRHCSDRCRVRAMRMRKELKK